MWACTLITDIICTAYCKEYVHLINYENAKEMLKSHLEDKKII